eukprot:COSAG03_NODE_10672_length_636_cov_1.594041_1_plen_71_part_00
MRQDRIAVRRARPARSFTTSRHNVRAGRPPRARGFLSFMVTNCHMFVSFNELRRLIDLQLIAEFPELQLF